jgi:galactose mutarotase-like enzyme
MERVPYLGSELLRWQVGRSTYLAMPELGARLMNWHVELGDGTLRDVVYWPELKSLENFAKVRGGNPVLFPFAGRCFADGEMQYWNGPDGVRRPMPMHGLARQGRFRLQRADAGGFSALFLPDDAARECYPYDYEFTVDYRFGPIGFHVEFALRNLGKTPVPWSAGHHFYFTIPWSEGLGRGNYTVQIPARRAYRQDSATGGLVPQPAPAPEAKLSNPDLIDCIHYDLAGAAVVATEYPTGNRLILRIGSDKAPPAGAAVLTWTEKPDSPFYCIEPWMGPPNAPAHKQGLHFVEPGQIQRFVVAVSLR